ncbi:MAG: cytochrome C [Burkholderiales bacterium]
MKPRQALRLAPQLVAALFATAVTGQGDGPRFMPNMLPMPNASGLSATYSTAGAIDLAGPFFRSLGTNGRSCASCHQPDDAWTITPARLRARFDASDGTDPVFRLNDGAVSPLADVSTVSARRNAYAMLLTKGLIRVGIGIPANAEFDLIAVEDPYGFASKSELSLFRRPLPSTNLKFLSTVMWDGRETFLDPASTDCLLGTTKCFASMHFDLADQSNSATLGHAQAAMPLSIEQREAIVAFETTLFTAQVFDDDAGNLTARKATGGPQFLSRQQFYFGINDVVAGDYRTQAAFDPDVFRLYDSWDTLDRGGEDAGRNDARRAVARGQRLFNRKPITITGVQGLNDDFSVPVLQGTCTTCHDAPGAGNHSVPAPLNIGLVAAARRTPDMPLYTLRQNTAPFDTIAVTDPGRALITGKWKDIGKFKGPILHVLAARAPYFHDGSAADLDSVVEFYDTRFAIGLTTEEKRDLVAFLRTL